MAVKALVVSGLRLAERVNKTFGIYPYILGTFTVYGYIVLTWVLASPVFLYVALKDISEDKLVQVAVYVAVALHCFIVRFNSGEPYA